MWGKSSRPEASFKKGVPRNYEDSQENTCVGFSFLIFNPLVPGGNKWPYVLKKTCSLKRLRLRYFPVNFAKLLRTPFFIEHLRWMQLNRSSRPEVSRKKVSLEHFFLTEHLQWQLLFEHHLCPWYIP